MVVVAHVNAVLIEMAAVEPRVGANAKQNRASFAQHSRAHRKFPLVPRQLTLHYLQILSAQINPVRLRVLSQVRDQFAVFVRHNHARNALVVHQRLRNFLIDLRSDAQRSAHHAQRLCLAIPHLSDVHIVHKHDTYVLPSPPVQGSGTSSLTVIYRFAVCLESV